jgi:hypothetical protein
MTFRKVNEALPNGLHDAHLHSFQMDYVRRILVFDVVVWTGDESRHELYRPARLTFEDVGFLFIEPPSSAVALPIDGPITIDAGEGVPESISISLPELPPENPVTWMYLNDWNSLLLFSAGSGAIEWTGDEEDWSLR